MYDNLHPSYEDIHNACKDIASVIDPAQLAIKHVVGIARGGLLPAVILSHLLNLPLLLVEYSSKDGNGDDKNYKNVLPLVTPQDGNVLVVDDICDSGGTLSEVAHHFANCGVVVYTATLYYKIQLAPQIVPDYVWKTIPLDAGWVIFPYERNEYLTSN